MYFPPLSWNGKIRDILLLEYHFHSKKFVSYCSLGFLFLVDKIIMFWESFYQILVLFIFYRYLDFFPYFTQLYRLSTHVEDYHT